MHEAQPLSAQLSQVREAVKQFPHSNVRRLSKLTLIARGVFHRRLIELQRRGLVTKNADGTFDLSLPVDEIAGAG